MMQEHTENTGAPWVTWAVITKNSDLITVYKRFNFIPETHGWCSGLFSDGKHAYILLTSKEASTPISGVVGTKYGYSLVMKDIIYNTDHYLRHFDLNEGTIGNIFIDSFTVKTENNVKTHFVAGNTKELHSQGANAYQTAATKYSFISKFVVDTAATDADNNVSNTGQFFCYTNTVFQRGCHINLRHPI